VNHMTRDRGMDTYLNNHLNITYKLNKVKLSSFGVDFTNIFVYTVH
jgi:hypothetical protein